MGTHKKLLIEMLPMNTATKVSMKKLHVELHIFSVRKNKKEKTAIKTRGILTLSLTNICMSIFIPEIY